MRGARSFVCFFFIVSTQPIQNQEIPCCVGVRMGIKYHDCSWLALKGLTDQRPWCIWSIQLPASRAAVSRVWPCRQRSSEDRETIRRAASAASAHHCYMQPARYPLLCTCNQECKMHCRPLSVLRSLSSRNHWCLDVYIKMMPCNFGFIH